MSAWKRYQDLLRAIQEAGHPPKDWPGLFDGALCAANGLQLPAGVDTAAVRHLLKSAALPGSLEGLPGGEVDGQALFFSFRSTVLLAEPIYSREMRARLVTPWVADLILSLGGHGQGGSLLHLCSDVATLLLASLIRHRRRGTKAGAHVGIESDPVLRSRAESGLALLGLDSSGAFRPGPDAAGGTWDLVVATPPFSLPGQQREEVGMWVDAAFRSAGRKTEVMLLLPAPALGWAEGQFLEGLRARRPLQAVVQLPSFSGFQNSLLLWFAGRTRKAASGYLHAQAGGVGSRMSGGEVASRILAALASGNPDSVPDLPMSLHDAAGGPADTRPPEDQLEALRAALATAERHHDESRRAHRRTLNAAGRT